MTYDPQMPQQSATPEPGTAYSTPQYGAPAYGAPQYNAYDPAHVEKLRSNATIVLVLGILSFLVTGPLTAIPGWIWGSKILNEAHAMGLSEDTVSLAKWGKVLSIINVVLTIVATVLVTLFFVFVILAANSHTF